MNNNRKLIDWQPCDSNPNHPDIKIGDRVLRIEVDMRGLPGYDCIVPEIGGTVQGFVTSWLGGKTYGTVIEWNDGSVMTHRLRDFIKV